MSIYDDRSSVCISSAVIAIIYARWMGNVGSVRNSPRTMIYEFVICPAGSIGDGLGYI